MQRRLVNLAAGAAIVLALSGCAAGNKDYVEIEADIAESFPLTMEPMGWNPQLVESNGPYALIHTTAGDIKIVLYPEQAPKAVENFISLAESGYYDDMNIFYVKKNQLFQTGRPDANEEGLIEEVSSFGEPFEDEFDDRLHNFTGAVAMAGDGLDQNQSQFYVVVSEAKTENPEEISANFYMNELIRKSSEELNEKNQESMMSEEEVQQFEDELNAKIQAIAEEGIPEEAMARYQPAIDQYMETGGLWSLDYKQTVFGQIVEGLNVAKGVTQVRVNPSDRSPKRDIVIKNIEIIHN